VLLYRLLLRHYLIVLKYYKEIQSKSNDITNEFSITAASIDDGELAEELRKDAMQRKA